MAKYALTYERIVKLARYFEADNDQVAEAMARAMEENGELGLEPVRGEEEMWKPGPGSQVDEMYPGEFWEVARV